MDRYLIVYGDDNSFFDVVASSFADAVLKFAKYTGAKLKPVCEKALKAMITPEEIVELYNSLTIYEEPIRSVFEIKSTIYSQEGEGSGGDGNG